MTATAELKKLKGSDRYDPRTKDGISKRWLPGSKAETFCAQGDEHSPDGSVDESAENAVAQLEKRMRKMEVLKSVMPGPELFVGASYESRVSSGKKIDLLIVSWGSNKGVILDVMKTLETQDSKLKTAIAYLHYTYLWPLRTELLEMLQKKAKRVVFVECNYQAQLLQLLRQTGGVGGGQKTILKYDGRPFFYGEFLTAIQQHLS